MVNTLYSVNEEAEPCPGCIGHCLRGVEEDRVRFAFRLSIRSLEAAFTCNSICLVSR